MATSTAPSICPDGRGNSQVKVGKYFRVSTPLDRSSRHPACRRTVTGHANAGCQHPRYAHRSDDRDHRFYREWLEQLVNGPEPFALSVLVAIAFVRTVTHPGFSPAPTPLPQALAVIEALRAHPGCRFLSPQGRHWTLFRQMAECAQATGKRIADAQHAALALARAHWTSRDRDFLAFESAGLRVEILDPR